MLSIYIVSFLKKLTQNFKLLHVFTSSIFKVFINHSEIVLCVPQDRYVCAVTKDTLGNSVPCAVLRPSWVWLLNCLFTKTWSDFIHFHTFRPCPHFFSCLSLKWSRSHYGVCGKARTERHDWSNDWRQTERKGHHTPSEGVYEIHKECLNVLQSVYDVCLCSLAGWDWLCRLRSGPQS